MSLVTKKALAASLKKLMATIPLEKIKIKDVAADCGVNRQTFSYHFQDIHELLAWIYRTEAISGIEKYQSYETWQEGFLKLFQYVEANKKICMNTLHSLSRNLFERFLYEVCSDLLMGVINDAAEGTSISEIDKQFIADFYASVFIGILIIWMEKGMQESPEQILHSVSTLVEGDIIRAIDKLTRCDVQ